MQHHKPERCAEKLIHYFQCQGHSEGLYNQNMTISAIISKLLVHLQFQSVQDELQHDFSWVADEADRSEF